MLLAIKKILMGKMYADVRLEQVHRLHFDKTTLPFYCRVYVHFSWSFLPFCVCVCNPQLTVLAAAVTQASLQSMLHKILTAGPSAFNITALLSQAAQHSNQGMATVKCPSSHTSALPLCLRDGLAFIMFIKCY